MAKLSRSFSPVVWVLNRLNAAIKLIVICAAMKNGIAILKSCEFGTYRALMIANEEMTTGASKTTGVSSLSVFSSAVGLSKSSGATSIFRDSIRYSESVMAMALAFNTARTMESDARILVETRKVAW